MRVLGLDLGGKTIGIAVSDPDGSVAHAVTTWQRRGEAQDFEEVARFLKEYETSRVVIGLPLNMNGSEGPQAEKARRFGEALRARLGEGVSVEFWDERLSTAGAERLLLEADLSRAKRRRVIDRLAAAFILQGFLDSRRGRG